MKQLDDATLGRITRAVLALDRASSHRAIGRVLHHLGGHESRNCEDCDNGEPRGILGAIAELDEIRAAHWWMEPKHSPSGKHVDGLKRIEEALNEVRRVLTEANES